jgi:hypothetical protein
MRLRTEFFNTNSPFHSSTRFWANKRRKLAQTPTLNNCPSHDSFLPVSHNDPVWTQSREKS